MKKTTKRNWIGRGILLIAGLILVALILVWYRQRDLAFNSRPLVLIQAPRNNKIIEVGEMISVHATAREDQGLKRVELWADGQLVDVLDAGETTPGQMTLSSHWTPTSIGHHLLIVRAFSADDIPGQSSIRILAHERERDSAKTHIIQEGETLVSIAAEYGISPEELEGANPGLGGEGLSPGGGLTIPDEEPETGEEESLGEDSEPPHPEGAPPLLELLGYFGVLERFGPDPGDATLQLEITSLRTWNPYQGLHCYLSLAGSLPQWYPDQDGDQATDESFEPLDHGWWETGPGLKGSGAPLISWPEDQALPVTISCIGIIEGGTEAVELGSAEFNLAPADWNGVEQVLNLDQGGGILMITFRVSRLESAPRGVPMYLDPEMTAPSNVHLDDRRISLKWEYLPEEDENPIDGFRVYLNGNLQWVEPADARESGIPYEWFNPPCGSSYNFAVTAFRIGYPDGPESYPGITILNQPLENCQREIQITFLTLETFDLGGDGRYENRHGDIGPVYGSFFANEKLITFDAGSEGPGLDMPNGLSHHTTYDLAAMSADPTWHFNSMNGTIVEVQPGGSFEFGYQLMDRDTGRCRDSDDPGCNDLICEGFSYRIYDNTTGELDHIHEGTLTSDNERCRVAYRWGPAFDSPVGSGLEGAVPLPWLQLTDLYISESTGEVEITLRNTWTATWPWKDLEIELLTRDGDSLGLFTWPEFVLEPGQETTLTHPGMVLDQPYDACVLIDPNDAVQEGPERTGVMFHQPICPTLPDLIITDVYYLPEMGGHLRATLQNNGGGALKDRSVTLTVTRPDGSALGMEETYPSIRLEPGESLVFDLGGVDRLREEMRGGYQVTVNPAGTIREENHDNNTYQVGEANRLEVYWLWIDVPYSVRNSVEFDLDAFVISGSDRQQVVNWSINQDIDWGSCFRPYHCVLHYDDYEYNSDWIDIYGDQSFEVIITVSHPGTLTRSYTLSDVYGPPNWGAGAQFNYGCSSPSQIEDGRHTWVFDHLSGEAWSTTFNLCLDNAER